MEVNEAISSVKLNKICSAEGLTFNLCISLNHFMVLENAEIETSLSRNVCIIESLLEQKFPNILEFLGRLLRNFRKSLDLVSRGFHSLSKTSANVISLESLHGKDSVSITLNVHVTDTMQLFSWNETLIMRLVYVILILILKINFCCNYEINYLAPVALKLHPKMLKSFDTYRG